MSDPSSNETDLIARDARRWVRRLASGEATTADAAELQQWRRLSSRHEAAFRQAVRFWHKLGAGSRAFAEAQSFAVRPERRVSVTRRTALLGGGMALAASVAGFAVVRPPFDLWPSLDEMTADYRTATGEQKRVIVANVAVQMNTQTSIAVPRHDGGKIDGVKLISGEAAFAVPAGGERPFVVFAGTGQTFARQARFEIRCLAATAFVTCFEGTVDVAVVDRTERLLAGQRIAYDNAGLQTALAVDIGEAAPWQDGFIVFRATPLADAVAEINRYRAGKVIVLNAALGRKTISGRFRIERTDEILGWIERATGATSRSLPGGVLLLS